MATIGSLVTQMTLESSAFRRDLERSTRAFGDAARQMERQSTLLQRGFDGATRGVTVLARGLGTLGVGLGVSAMVGMTRATVANAAAMQDAADKIGVTAQQLQVLRFGAEQSGVATNTLDMAMQRFSRRVGEAAQGGGVLAETLKRNDIAIRDSEGNMRPLVDVLRDYADLIADTPSAQEQLTLAFKAFDSEGAALVNMLRDGSGGLEEFARQARIAGIATNQQIDALARADDAIARLSTTISTTFTSALGGSILAVEDLLSHLSELELFGGSGGRFTLADRMLELSAEIADASEQLNQAPAGARSGIQTRLDALRAEADAVAAQLSALQQQEQGQRNLRTAIEPTTTAIAEQADALGDMVARANREHDQMLALVAAHKGYGATVEQVNAAVEIDNQLRAAKISQLDAEQSGLLATLRANQKLEQEIRSVTDAQAEQEAAAQQAAAERERQAAETERLLAQPFENFLSSFQSSTTDAFEKIYSGGVTTFEDLFETAKRLAIRFAAELTSLAIFSPNAVLGLAGATGAAPGASSGGGLLSGFGGLGGLFDEAGFQLGFASPAGTPGGATPGFFGGTATFGQTATAAGFGAAGGALIGSQFGGQGALGGTIGGATGAAAGALIGSAFFGVGAPLGGLIGGLIGAGAGAGAGSLFGGSERNRGFISGGLGNVSAQGSGDLDAVASVVAAFDQEIINLLNSRQREIVDKALRNAEIRVDFNSFDANIANFAASERARDIARALGFNASGIAPGSATAQQAAQNIATALQVQRAIEDITGSVSAFDRQVEDATLRFEDLDDKARRFGISIEGLAEAQKDAIDDLRKAQDASLAALLDPFEALIDPLEAFRKSLEFSGLNPVQQFELAQEEFRRIAEEAAGGSTEAIEQLVGAGQIFIQAANAFGASPAAASARAEVLAGLSSTIREVEDARTEASRDAITAIQRADERNIDRLDELVESVRELINETKRGRNRI